MNLGFHCGIDCCVHGLSATCHNKSNQIRNMVCRIGLPCLTNQPTLLNAPSPNTVKPTAQFQEIAFGISLRKRQCHKFKFTCHGPNKRTMHHPYAMTASSTVLCRALMCYFVASGAMSCCGVVVSFVALS